MPINNEAVELEQYFDRLWPICRSLTGKGFRQSLDILSELVPLERLRFPTGSKVFDWTVPKEWNVNDAYLVDPQGRKFAQFQQNNLHLMGYSSPFRGELSLTELKLHLYSIPEQPALIPYFTSYYKERWGFCITHQELQSLPDGKYQVMVDTELSDGELVLGEVFLPGESRKEVLFSTYLCHPSLANNELSGPLAVAFLYRKIAALPRRHFSYRFLFSAETLGTVAFLSKRGEHLRENLIAGY